MPLIVGRNTLQSLIILIIDITLPTVVSSRDKFVTESNLMQASLTIKTTSDELSAWIFTVTQSLNYISCTRVKEPCSFDFCNFSCDFYNLLFLIDVSKDWIRAIKTMGPTVMSVVSGWFLAWIRIPNCSLVHIYQKENIACDNDISGSVW